MNQVVELEELSRGDTCGRMLGIFPGRYWVAEQLQWEVLFVAVFWQRGGSSWGRGGALERIGKFEVGAERWVFGELRERYFWGHCLTSKPDRRRGVLFRGVSLLVLSTLEEDWRHLQLNRALLEKGSFRYECNWFIIWSGFLLLLYDSYWCLSVYWFAWGE